MVKNDIFLRYKISRLGWTVKIYHGVHNFLTPPESLDQAKKNRYTFGLRSVLIIFFFLASQD